MFLIENKLAEYVLDRNPDQDYEIENMKFASDGNHV